MAAFALVSETILLGTAWTGTAPGLPGTQTISGTITSTSDISTYTKNVGEPGWDINMLDTTNMGSGGYTAVIPGLTSGKPLTFTANSDLAASQLHSILFTTLGGPARPGSSPIYIDIKATSSARAATNPSFVAAVWLSNVSSITGSVGDLAVASFTLTLTGAFGYLTA